jgi:hypothetical protein
LLWLSVWSSGKHFWTPLIGSYTHMHIEATFGLRPVFHFDAVEDDQAATRRHGLVLVKKGHGLA